MSRTGYIETRLRNFRRTLEADKKKYVLKRRRAELGVAEPKPRAGSGEGQGADETRKWVALMKKTCPLTKNLPTIRSGMERTFAARRKWMSSKRPSVNAVLAEYPRFLDVPSTVRPVAMDQGLYKRGTIPLLLLQTFLLAELVPHLFLIAAVMAIFVP